MAVLGDYLPEKPKGRTLVVGAGKGAAQLARAFEQLWSDECDGVVVTPYGHATECKRIRVMQAAHPVSDAAGLKASEALLQTVSDLTADDLVVALVCGGGSALLPAPPPGCTLEDEQALHRALLVSGAPISAINAIRKQFSRIKGGRLARAAAPARVVSLIVSDIPGDDPTLVASGPTVADNSSREIALDAIAQYKIDLPANLRNHLALPEAQSDPPPLATDPCFANNETHIIASAQQSLQAAAEHARRQGVAAHILSDSIEGEAREVARVHAAIARQILRNGQPFSPPLVLLSGGETTVRVTGSGKGGRNSEFMLSLLMDIAGLDGVTALAADTDGIDGSEDNAGAFADSTSRARLGAKGLNPARLLGDNDAWSAFHQLEDLFVTGPTGVNVNDFRALLVDPREN